VVAENNASDGRPAREKGAVTVPTPISLSPVAFEREERRNEMRRIPASRAKEKPVRVE